MELSDEELIRKFNLGPKDKILDIGGSAKQHDKIAIHTLVDILRPEEMPYWPGVLRAKKFVRLDITAEKLPFADREFDFCVCTHTLEDVHNPFLVIPEMARVAKRGYISTPARGKDMVFSHFDITDWLTGGVRVPGHAHHKWLFENIKGTMVITIKNYPLLYSPEFQVTGWTGEDEFRFYWEKKIDFKVVNPISHHELIAEYRDFVARNRDKIRRGRVAVFVDRPDYMFKAWVKRLLKRGSGYKYLK